MSNIQNKDQISFEWYQWFVLFIPIVFGNIVAFMTPSLKGAGVRINARPPAWVFGIVWSILFLLFGLSWAFAIDNENIVLSDPFLKEKDIEIIIYFFYSLTFFFLMLWTPVYFYSEKYALYILTLTIMGTICCFGLGPIISKICLSPLLAWLLFAFNLNYTIVNT